MLPIKYQIGKDLHFVQENDANQIVFTTLAKAAYGIPIQDRKVWQPPTYIYEGEYDDITYITKPLNETKVIKGHQVKAFSEIKNNANITLEGSENITLRSGFHAKRGAKFTSYIKSGKRERVPMRFLSGDFNGDGITDVIAITESHKYRRRCYGESVCYDNLKNETSEVHYINLDRRIRSNFANKAGVLELPLDEKSIIKTGDFNGDGVTDIFHFVSKQVFVYYLRP